jgi:hypothetical protein
VHTGGASPSRHLRGVERRPVLTERLRRSHLIALAPPGRRATRELRGTHAPTRLSATKERHVELTGGDRSGGVVEEHLWAIAADSGALDRLARMKPQILRNESRSVRVMPPDHRDAPHRVGATDQPLVRPAVLDSQSHCLTDQRDRFACVILVCVAPQHLSGADNHWSPWIHGLLKVAAGARRGRRACGRVLDRAQIAQRSSTSPVENTTEQLQRNAKWSQPGSNR